MKPEATQRTFVKRVTTKLCVTIEEEMSTQQAMTQLSPISPCSQGYAVYAYRSSRTLQRVGGSTCQFPHSGYSAASAQRYLTISIGLSNQFASILKGHPTMRELRFAVCCPPPASIVPAPVTAKQALQKQATKREKAENRKKAEKAENAEKRNPKRTKR